ncbi:uroporphyrinogen-III C-methyltransferase [Pseudodonghicola flavimaris]|uniref:uroporphyrinogen-III C-methyltransferase n=1 Tax=Pseudodonghicola flavimaris TaxID=3050036 RepID=A0ABT7F6T9_9RHOB|nr:uroporphyrinogen-III C-methyltransferase [Pseudodonghicola flavimaris]MDK3020326.1 uroporphyrinogen-III C-methyltransferase [Pseudodonghicola flavimaris]
MTVPRTTQGFASGHVRFVGAGPGDPELLTLAALRALETAEVILHDRLISTDILALAGPAAQLTETGKTGFGQAMKQDDINARIVAAAQSGARVVRLKSGDATVFGRLDEEIEACDAAGISWSIVPGITAASAAVAAIGQSLTRRGRNSAVRLITGHDVEGYADHDWAVLARPGEVAAIYMGLRAARFLQGRLIMHGADRATPVTLVANASRPDQQVLATTLDRLTDDLARAELSGPVLTLFGLAPRTAEILLPALDKERA